MKRSADKTKTAGGWRGALARLDADEAKADRDWRIRCKSMDGNPRLLAAVEGRAAQSSDDADGGGMMDALRSLLAFVLALPMPRRVIVIEWLAAGRNITRAMVRDYHRSYSDLRRMVAESRIVAFLDELAEGYLQDKRQGEGRPPPIGSSSPAPTGIPGGDPRQIIFDHIFNGCVNSMRKETRP